MQSQSNQLQPEQLQSKQSQSEKLSLNSVESKQQKKISDKLFIKLFSESANNSNNHFYFHCTILKLLTKYIFFVIKFFFFA